MVHSNSLRFFSCKCIGNIREKDLGLQTRQERRKGEGWLRGEREVCSVMLPMLLNTEQISGYLSINNLYQRLVDVHWKLQSCCRGREQ